MPYTRNTRIKVTDKLHSTEYEAQVEYRYPFTDFTKWVNFVDVPYATILQVIFCDTSGNLGWQADRDCIHNEELDDVVGLEWTKAQIDAYHKLFDEQEFTPTVKYVKYPQGEM